MLLLVNHRKRLAMPFVWIARYVAERGSMDCARRHGKLTRALTDVHIRGFAMPLALLALAQAWPDNSCLAGGTLETPNPSDAAPVVEVESVGRWLRARFSSDELLQVQTGDIEVERQHCSCYDQPTRHYPYSLVVITTPRGDLIARPEGAETSVTLNLLAVRHGEWYCEVDSQHCFGSFLDVCSFTDYRYGPYLAQYFPTCMQDEDIEGEDR
jgi:hypothetical protein